MNKRIDSCDGFSSNVERLLKLLASGESTPVIVMSVDDIVDIATSQHFGCALSALHWLVKFVNGSCLHVGDVRISLDCAESINGVMGGGYRFVADCGDHLVTTQRTFDL